MLGLRVLCVQVNPTLRVKLRERETESLFFYFQNIFLNKKRKKKQKNRSCTSSHDNNGQSGPFHFFFKKGSGIIKHHLKAQYRENQERDSKKHHP